RQGRRAPAHLQVAAGRPALAEGASHSLRHQAQQQHAVRDRAAELATQGLGRLAVYGVRVVRGVRVAVDARLVDEPRHGLDARGASVCARGHSGRSSSAAIITFVRPVPTTLPSRRSSVSKTVITAPRRSLRAATAIWTSTVAPTGTSPRN